jgi:stage II sporulation protein M
MAEAGMDPIKSIIFGILPHGVFELPGLFISIALGFYLCRYMTRALFRRKQEQTLLEILNAVAKGYVTVVLPLLTIASVIECFVTPELMAWAGL